MTGLDPAFVGDGKYGKEAIQICWGLPLLRELGFKADCGAIPPR
jgi:hypothetical protein